MLAETDRGADSRLTSVDKKKKTLTGTAHWIKGEYGEFFVGRH